MTLRRWVRQLHTNEGGFLLPAALGLVAGQLFGGGGGRGESRSAELLPEQRELLDIQRRRLLASDPLYNAIIRLAMTLLPGGIGGMQGFLPGDGTAGALPSTTPPEGAGPEPQRFELPMLERRFAESGATRGAGIPGLDRLLSRFLPGLRQQTQRAQLDAAAQAAARAAAAHQARRAGFGPQLTADLASGAGWGNLPGGVGELAQIRAESQERGGRIDELMRELRDFDFPGTIQGPELFA